MGFLSSLGDILKKIIPVSPGEVAQPRPPADRGAAVWRPWRLTYYYVADQSDSSGPAETALLGRKGNVIAHVEASFFARASLEGTGRLRDGRIVNVSGGTVSVIGSDYADVLAYHHKFLPGKDPSYSGLRVGPTGVHAVLAFDLVAPNQLGEGWGQANGYPYVPFRTVAADLGRYSNGDPRYKGAGGLVPTGTMVRIEQFIGKSFPDGKGGSFVHDGWVRVTDTGGGIFGAHFDVFTGTRTMGKQALIPGKARITFDNIASRVPDGYSYGLTG